MFGWEFPPHISGGLGTACLGITQALSAYPDIELTFVIPKTSSNQPTKGIKLIGANEINVIESKIKLEKFCGPHTYLSIDSMVMPYIDPDEFIKEETSIKEENRQTSVFTGSHLNFSGKYGVDLMSEIHNFSVIAEHIAKKGNYDIIHAHDWLTFPAGMMAKNAIGKPLIVHVHATDFDRSGGNVNPRVYGIEKAGMDCADGIIAVSNLTKQIIAEKYMIPSSKIFTVHNGVSLQSVTKKIKRGEHGKRRVTFLGRITFQKGPWYFIEVARKVMSRMDDVEFVMAGSGDMLDSMKELTLNLGLSEHFVFPGFLNEFQVARLLDQTDVYIMPSVSEPFGITPLEAMRHGVPVIISKQSGVAEIVENAIKLDFWDTDAMADAVCRIFTLPRLKKNMHSKGLAEVKRIRWEDTATKIVSVYQHLS